MVEQSSFEKMLSGKLYMAGTFFQLDWFNPLYLDKTGLAISKTDGRLEAWNGNINAFQYASVDGFHIGKVSIDQYWMQKKEQAYFSPGLLHAVRDSIQADLSDWNEVYDIKYLKRIGLRTQCLFDKYAEPNLKIFNNIFVSHVQVGNGLELKTVNAGFELSGKEYNARLTVSWATKLNDEMPGPDKGFMIDIDIYKLFEKLKWTTESYKREVDGFFEYCDESYLNHVSTCLGMLGFKK